MLEDRLLATAAIRRKGEGRFFLPSPVGLTDISWVVGRGIVLPTFGLGSFLGFLVRNDLGSRRWGSTWRGGETEPLEVLPHTNTTRKVGVSMHSGVHGLAERSGALRGDHGGS